MLSLSSSGNKQDTQHLVGFFEFWKMHIPPLGILLAPIHKAICRKVIFEWGPEKHQAMSEMQKSSISDFEPL